MATTAEAAICNLALARMGERSFITTLDTSVDRSQSASLCAVLYPSVRDAMLARHPWTWAQRAAVLAPGAPASTYDGAPARIPGWKHAYAVPTDLIEAQYIFSGVRPGSAVIPLIDQSGIFGALVPLLPVVGGTVPQIPFEVQAQSVLTDWEDPIPNWDATVRYAPNAVVSYGGANYRSIIAGANLNNMPTDATKWLAATDPSQATLVYTAQVTDSTLFPFLVKEAIAWRLASDLALSLATKPDLAAGIEKAAEVAYDKALAAEGNARAPDPKPASRYISIRQ